jgi:hypothetical protein
VLLVLKAQGLANDTRGLCGLRDVQVKEVGGNYWLKITGVAACPRRCGLALVGGVCSRSAQRPGSMALYYVQTALQQKLEVSNFGTRWIFDERVNFPFWKSLAGFGRIGLSRCSCSGGVAVVLVFFGSAVCCFVTRPRSRQPRQVRQ